MTDLRNMFIFRYFNILAKVANSLPVIFTLWLLKIAFHSQ